MKCLMCEAEIKDAESEFLKDKLCPSCREMLDNLSDDVKYRILKALDGKDWLQQRVELKEERINELKGIRDKLFAQNDDLQKLVKPKDLDKYFETHRKILKFVPSSSLLSPINPYSPIPQKEKYVKSPSWHHNTLGFVKHGFLFFEQNSQDILKIGSVNYILDYTGRDFYTGEKCYVVYITLISDDGNTVKVLVGEDIRGEQEAQYIAKGIQEALVYAIEAEKNATFNRND